MIMQGGGDKDVIAFAVREAIQPIATLEKEWDAWKLEGRMNGYFRNGTKGCEFDTRPWDELVYLFAHNVFNSIFSALPDRPWLNQIDLLKVMCISVQNLFPAALLAEVDPQVFEKTVMCAHDQAYEEQRFQAILHEILCSQFKDKKMRSKVYTALDSGRKEAAQTSLAGSGSPAEDFVSSWIACSINRLRAECGGWPENLLQRTQAVWLFNHLIEAGAFPVSLLVTSGPVPNGWPVVTTAVHSAYDGKGRGKGCGKNSGAAPTILPLYSMDCNPAYSTNGQANGGNGMATDGNSDLIPRGVGHPQCAQADDCIGTPEDKIWQHMEGPFSEEKVKFRAGDLYCDSCWQGFLRFDPTLKAVPFKQY
jgi:hypothetical protein